MKLEQQVTSLELSKRLKELGVKQESIWWWRDGVGTALRCNLYPAQYDTQDVYEAYAAFTVAELGEMLPQEWLINSRTFRTVNNGWGMVIEEVEDTNIYADTEAEARGLMLAYLIENNLLSV